MTKITEKIYLKKDDNLLQFEYILPNIGRKVIDAVLVKSVKKFTKKTGLQSDKDAVSDVIKDITVLKLDPRSFFVMEQALAKNLNKALKKVEKKHSLSCVSRPVLVEAVLSKMHDGSFSITVLFEGVLSDV